MARLPTVVIDIGTSTAKAGFSSDMGPQLEVPSLARAPKAAAGETQTTGDYREQSRIMERGIVTNFSRLEILWSDIFHLLGISSPSEYALFLTNRDLTPKANKEKSLQIMFEEFQVASLSFGLSSVCSVVGSGRLHGTAVNLGGGTCIVSPVYDGYPICSSIHCLNLAGDDITEHLMNILNREGSAIINWETAKHIKESMAYIAPESQMDVSQTPKSSYALPDGQLLTLGGERHACIEPLFSPALMEKEGLGLHQCISSAYESLIRCKQETKPFSNLILAGGTSLLPGVKERLQRQLSPLLPPGVSPSYTLLPNRRHLSWHGASLISTMSTFGEETYTQEQYEESGPSLVHRKIY